MAEAMAAIMGATALLVLSLLVCASATVHTVGDSNGWSPGVDYRTWAGDKTFAVDDTLVFNYGGGFHSVQEVSSTDYASCTTGNALTSDSSGSTSITLKTAGAHYFICGAPGHCNQGMKLAVTVGVAAGGGGSSSEGTAPPLPVGEGTAPPLPIGEVTDPPLPTTGETPRTRTFSTPNTPSLTSLDPNPQASSTAMTSPSAAAFVSAAAMFLFALP
ncbi:hypothetical protein H6P81_010690 [Aristolochia fimbriata]|uniref:Phytocyanin domain-containing protein n=1 Tax=Aristolochia fimbriata TaxID=158543 RepID=A0AAV7EPH8_ARIFI|nr:hypothetical protein H6P81_010690 [Aristolochia fimbriata]